jgi:hypothetical protein
MGTELPTKVMLGQTLVLMQITFLNNVRKVGRLVLSRTSCILFRGASRFKQLTASIGRYSSRVVTASVEPEFKTRQLNVELVI